MAAASAVSLSFTPKPKPKPTCISLSSSSSLFFGSNRPGLKLISNQRSAKVISNGRKGLRVKCLFGLGVPELVVIAGVAALVFGPKKLPEVGRSIGKTVKSFQQAAKEFETELKKEPDSVPNEQGVEKVKEVIQEEKPDPMVSSTNDS